MDDLNIDGWGDAVRDWWTASIEWIRDRWWSVWDGFTERWDRIETWLNANQLMIDVWLVWSIVISLCILALVEIGARIVLQGQFDQTGIGRALRGKKVSLAVMFVALAALFGLSLYAYYTGHVFTLWERLTLRIFLLIGIYGAVFFGVRFIWSLALEAYPDLSGRFASWRSRWNSLRSRFQQWP